MIGAAAVAGKIIKTLLTKPKSPTEGPPLPAGLDVSWPGFVKRGVERLKKVGR